MKFSLRSLFVFLLLFSFAGCRSSAQPKLETRMISIEPHPIELEVEIADEPREREKGLMFRKSLSTGMLFVFPNEMPLKFWMKNTLISLDMLFINREQKIVGIFENVQPCREDPCETYGPDIPTQYVLELPGGFAKMTSIKLGDWFSWDNVNN